MAKKKKAVKKKVSKKKHIKHKAPKKKQTTHAVIQKEPPKQQDITLDSGKEVLQIAMVEAPEITVSEPEPILPQKASEPKSTTEWKPKKKIRKGTSQDKYFILCNGRRLKNVKELADIMEEIEDHVFNHHVTHDRNDFAKWINDVFEDIELAQKLANVKDKKHVQFIIYKHITNKLW